MCTLTRPASQSAVLISQASGNWNVTVRECEGEAVTLSFAMESFAPNCAEGHRIRVGLDGVLEKDRLTPSSSSAPCPAQLLLG
jgi:hypothetical protein